jgi:hypothetical protein
MSVPQNKKQLFTADDIENILKVNSKTIEVELRVAEQNEEIIRDLDEKSKDHAKLIEGQIVILTKAEKIDSNIIKLSDDLSDNVSDPLSKFEREFHDYKRDFKELYEFSKAMKDEVKAMKNEVFKLTVLMGTGIVAIIIDVLKTVILKH